MGSWIIEVIKSEVPKKFCKLVGRVGGYFEVNGSEFPKNFLLSSSQEESGSDLN